ncbi:MAG: ABC transporter ATP-binding protein [Acidobacteria bacterium]|nr:ABC transporter ATP-binding protein [Acidobacteriota bacterium]
MNIELRNLTVRYGRRVAVDDVSLTVERGAVYALLGRNGSGKSSLIKVLLGQRRADGGTATVGGIDPWRRRAALMARIGATPETPDAPPALTVGAIERSVAPLYRNWNRSHFDERLERFGIGRRTRFGDLSRGQKSLVMLALALGHAPELLILDDPTLGLDAIARRFFYEELVVDLADRGTTVLLASHDLDGVERVATHAGVLAAGRLIAQGSLEELTQGSTLEDLFVSLVGEERRAS